MLTVSYWWGTSAIIYIQLRHWLLEFFNGYTAFKNHTMVTSWFYSSYLGDHFVDFFSCLATHWEIFALYILLIHRQWDVKSCFDTWYVVECCILVRHLLTGKTPHIWHFDTLNKLHSNSKSQSLYNYGMHCYRILQWIYNPKEWCNNYFSFALVIIAPFL